MDYQSERYFIKELDSANRSLTEEEGGRVTIELNNHVD